MARTATSPSDPHCGGRFSRSKKHGVAGRVPAVDLHDTLPRPVRWRSSVPGFLPPIFLAIDAVWIGVVMKSFYNAELGSWRSGADRGAFAAVDPAVLVYALAFRSGDVAFVRPGRCASRRRWARQPDGATVRPDRVRRLRPDEQGDGQEASLRMTLVDLVWGDDLCPGGGDCPRAGAAG